jgi:pimeloyl-ACP methyl ester carboxylesterase
MDADTMSVNTIEAMSTNLLKAISSTEIALIGISMGGYVAIDAALKSKKIIKKLILINTTAKPVNVNTILDREKAIEFANEEMMEEIMNMSEGVCFYNKKKEWLLLERKMAKEVGLQAYIRQQQAIITRKDYSSLISKIESDTLIISGKNDLVIPYQESIEMFNMIPSSSLKIFNECGHLSTLEKGEMVTHLVDDFLR